MTSVLFAAGTFLHYVFGILIFAVSVFLILLVLVQRGRGGGLTGALGGMGGQSAFGTKAGDTFTRVTMVTAAVWIGLCMLSIWFLGSQDQWGESSRARPGGGTSATTPLPEREDTSAAPAPAAAAASSSTEASPNDSGGTGAGAGEAKAASGGGSAAPADAAPPVEAPQAKQKQ